MSLTAMSPRRLLILAALAVVLVLLKYRFDQSATPPPPEASAFDDLYKTMEQRLVGISDSVKRRVNQYDGRFDYLPYQASYQVLIHLDEVFSGQAIANLSKDCEDWREDFAMQLKPLQGQQMVFDYQVQRREDLNHRNAEIISQTRTWVNGRQEDEQQRLLLERNGNLLTMHENGDDVQLDPDTKLNIEAAQFILRQIELENYELEYHTEPSELTAYAIRNEVSIVPFKSDYMLDNTWLVKSREYKFVGEAYSWDSSTLELINDKATTLYSITLDNEGVLYELILSDFEYKPSRCQQFAAL